MKKVMFVLLACFILSAATALAATPSFSNFSSSVQPPAFSNISGAKIPRSYKVTDLGIGPIKKINNNGQALSHYCLLYDNGTVTSLSTPILPCYGVDLNNKGQALLQGNNSGAASVHLYSNGVVSQVSTAPWNAPSWSVEPVALNDSGKIVANAAYSYWLKYSLLIDSTTGAITNLSPLIPSVNYSGPFSINSNGDVAGWYWDAGYHSTAYVIKNNVFTQVPYYYPVISDSGLVVGSRGVVDPVTNTQSEHLFFLKDGVETDLGNMGTSYLRPYGVNSSGVAVGCGSFPFVADGTALYNLNSLIPAGTPGISCAYSINSFGQIAADGFLLTPVTPPVTIAYQNAVAETVTLQATDTDFGVKEIRYTLNGGTEIVELANNVTIALVPGIINTVSYYAVDKADNVEATRQIIVDLDTVAPVTSAALNGTQGQNGWFTSPVQVSLSATDNSAGVARTEYSLNGTAWVTYVAPLNITANGTTTIYYRSIDKDNNVEVADTVVVAIDQNAPVTVAAVAGTAGTNGWYTSNVQVSLNWTDLESGIARTEYSLNQTAWSTYAGAVTLAAEGTTTLYFRSVDVAGNIEAVKSVTVKIDKTAPFVSSTTPANKATGVLTTSSIKMVLSETVAKGAAFSAIVLKQGTTTVATTSTLSGNTLTIKPNKALSKSKPYTVTLPGGAVVDAAGIKNAAKVVSFTTGTR